MKITSAAAGVFLAMFATAVLSQGQPDQKIWYQYCVAQPDSDCFNPVNGTIDSVGMDVAELGGDFRFCLQVDTVDSGVAPIRVILVLDESGSMCNNYGDNCCTEGDGSGNCARNDPNNMRVEAANAFVDSLKALSPTSQIGVITYVGSATVKVNPTSLENNDDVTEIHDAINSAGCDTRNTLAKKAATKETNLGNALSKALDEADRNFDKIPPYMKRHIILLTDGAWDDVDNNPPMEIINNYRTENAASGRELPQIHGVFISDSLTHVTHGYPAQGCASGGSAVELSNLKTAADSSEGQYFGGTTPQTIVQNFMVLLDSIAVITNAQVLVSVKVTNSTNNTSSTHSSIKQVGSSLAYEATLNSLPLVFGPNNLSIEHTISRPGRTDTTITNQVTIIRSTGFRQALDKDLFKLYCDLSSAGIKISATPEKQLINLPVAVNATLSNAENFNLSDVQVRLLTRFPDSEQGVIATFHLDDNNNDGSVTNSADPNKNGVGSPDFTTAAQLFGSAAINGKSFDYATSPINEAFTIEEWVKPKTGTAAVLISGCGIEFGMDANSKLYFKTDAGEMVSASTALDPDVWTHVSVAREAGQAVLFINGIAVSEPVAVSSSIKAGSLTFAAPKNWIVDEIRISNISRMKLDGTTRTISIPALTNIAWNLQGTASSGQSLNVAASAWTQNGTSLDFTCASPVAGTVVVNIRQNQAGAAGTGWSKNSNPVSIIVETEKDGPYVVKGILTPVKEGNKDTLLIKLSEAVQCTSLLNNSSVNASFEFYVKGKKTSDVGAQYLATNCLSNDATISEVTVTVTKGAIEPERDSLLLIGNVVDVFGNKPDPNKKAPVEWGSGRGIEVLAWTTGSNLKIPEKMKEEYGISGITNGKVVTVKTVVPLLPVDTINGKVSYGKATIYDAVGNIVALDLDLLETDKPRNYYILWDGTNRNHRRVSNGAYYIISKFSYIDKRKGEDGTKFRIKW